jgi:hypothetical protein
MTRPLPALDLDLVIEHGGRQLKLTGSGSRFIARFPTLSSLIYFARNFWSWKNQIPEQMSLQAEWWLFRVPVKTAKMNKLS